MSGYLLLATKLFTEGKKYSGGRNFGPLDQASHKVTELIEEIIKYYKKGNVIYSDETKDFHEASLLKLDISKALWELNWKPVLNFEELIKLTVDGYIVEFGDNDIYAERKKQIIKYVDLARLRKIGWAENN